MPGTIEYNRLSETNRFLIEMVLLLTLLRINKKEMPHNAGKRLVDAIKKQLERIEYFSSAENVSPCSRRFAIGVQLERIHLFFSQMLRYEMQIRTSIGFRYTFDWLLE